MYYTIYTYIYTYVYIQFNYTILLSHVSVCFVYDINVCYSISNDSSSNNYLVVVKVVVTIENNSVITN